MQNLTPNDPVLQSTPKDPLFFQNVNVKFQICHSDVILWLIFMILVSMERRDPTVYYGTK